MRVAIVGGGAAGVLTAAHLRRVRPDAQITLIDASGRPGTGAAYRTGDPVHLLNVPAHRMSAWPDDPDHFCRWLDDHAVTALEGFAPRLAYARHLQDQLVAADVRVETAEVVGLVPGASTQVKLGDGRSLSADAERFMGWRTIDGVARPRAVFGDARARSEVVFYEGAGAPFYCAVATAPATKRPVIATMVMALLKQVSIQANSLTKLPAK